MKRSLRYMGWYSAQVVLTAAGVLALMAALTALLGPECFFATYLTAFDLIGYVLCSLMSFSIGRVYGNEALAFGATRREVFWATELSALGMVPFMLLVERAARLLNVLLVSVPLVGYDRGSILPGGLLFHAAFQLLLVQAGITGCNLRKWGGLVPAVCWLGWLGLFIFWMFQGDPVAGMRADITLEAFGLIALALAAVLALWNHRLTLRMAVRQ